MREWLVIEDSGKHTVFCQAFAKPDCYITRDVAEKLLGRDLGGTVWFTREESEKMHACPEFTERKP